MRSSLTRSRKQRRTNNTRQLTLERLDRRDLLAADGFALSFGTSLNPDRVDDVGDAIAVDNQGNLYIASTDQAGIHNDGWERVDVDKYSADGELIWKYQRGSRGDIFSSGIAVAEDGSVFETGAFKSTIQFDFATTESIRRSAGSFDFYVLKLTPEGHYDSVLTFGQSGGAWDRARDIAVDRDGNVVVTGYFGGRMDFDPDPNSELMLSANGSNEMFVMKLTPDGDLLWAKAIGGDRSEGGTNEIESAESVTTDSEGNVYVGGYFVGEADFDRDASYADNRDRLTARGTWDGFLAKYDTSGSLQWVRQMGATGTNYDAVLGVAVDGQGNPIVTGTFQGSDFDPGDGSSVASTNGGFDVLVSKFDPAGNLMWSQRVGDTGDDRGRAVAVDGNGLVHVGGFFNGIVDFDPSASGEAVLFSGNPGFVQAGTGFLLTLDAAGNFVSVGRHGGSGRDAVIDVAADAAGNAYMTGFFENTATFDVGSATVELTSHGGKDVFVAKVVRTAPDPVAETLMQVRLETTDLDGNPTASVRLGDEFLLRAVVSDTRPNGGGVFAAYLDVNYDPELVSRRAAVTFGDAFPHSREASYGTAGLIDEVGAASERERLGLGEFVLFSVPFEASELGTATFFADPADLLPQHASLLYDRNEAVPADNIEFIAVSIDLISVPFNVPPVANDDSGATVENFPVTIAVLTNDFDVDGTLDVTSVNIVAVPTHGTVIVHPTTGEVTYVPDLDFAGSDYFEYTVNDDQGAVSNPARVTVTVTLPPNHQPMADDDNYVLDEDQTLVVGAPGVLTNDADEDGDELTAVLVNDPGNGTLRLIADGSFTYTPNANFYGTDSFSYQASDGVGNSESAVVTLTINPVNDAPVAANDTATTLQETSVTVDVLENDVDIDSRIDVSTVELTSPPAHGLVEFDRQTGNVIYSPAVGFVGEDHFSYTVDDDQGARSNLATVSITVVRPANRPPRAGDDSTVTLEDEAVTVDVLENDRDPDGDQLTVMFAESDLKPAHGQLVLNSDGSITYTPASDFHGEDQFEYTIADAEGLRDTGRVSVVVTSVNDAPVAVSDDYATDEDTQLVVATAFGVLGNDRDVDGDDLTAILVTAATHGTIALNATGSFTYTPDNNFHGTDSIAYRANDGLLDSNVSTVTIAVNPVAGISVSPLSLETDERSGTAEFTVVLESRPATDVTIDLSSSDPGEGMLSINPLVFTPQNWAQPQTVTVTGVDDDVDDGDVAYTILTVPAASGDPNYHGLDAADVSVVNRDDDTAAVLLVETNGSTQVSEDGGRDSYTVVLTSEPIANVTITIQPDRQLHVEPAALTFSPENWHVAQTVTVHAVDDSVVEGTHSGLITHTLTSDDLSYGGITIPNVSVEIADNDAARIIFRADYLDDPGEGFFDPVLGSARRAAFEFALGIWSDFLVAAYEGETITIDVLMDPLGGNDTKAVLAGAAPATVHRSFGGALSNTWYGAPLANHLAGFDLYNAAEVSLVVNSDVDNATVLGASDWYYGTDAQPGNHIDFVSTVLHELGHGLNFFDLINQDGRLILGNAPGIWERFIELGDGTDLVTLSTTARAQALTSNDLHWSGDNGVGGNSNTRPRLFAPPVYQLGSSTSHLDEATHGNELMSPFYSGPDHEPSSMELGMLADMGWDVANSAAAGESQLVVIGLPSLIDHKIGTGEALRNQSFGVYGVGSPDSVTTWIDSVKSVLSTVLADEIARGADQLNAPKNLQNSLNHHDVNDDGFVTPIDVLMIVNDLNGDGPRRLTVADATSAFIDVNGDSFVTPLDALQIINLLNTHEVTNAAEGEASSTGLVVTSRMYGSMRAQERQGEATNQVSDWTSLDLQNQKALEVRVSASQQLQTPMNSSQLWSEAMSLCIHDNESSTEAELEAIIEDIAADVFGTGRTF